MNSTFLSDVSFPNQQHGMLIRSSIQRGNLIRILTPELPPSYYLFTADDIPGENKLSFFNTEIPIFAKHEIKYFGEPLGLIVGPDIAVLEKLISQVTIETEKLEPLIFNKKFPASQIAMKKVVIEGDPDSLFAENNTIFETNIETGLLDHYYSETLGACAAIKAGKLEVYTASQWPSHVRSSVSQVLDLDPNDISLKPTHLGEAMDGKIWYPSLLACQAALASVLIKKPVKIMFTRIEDFLFSIKSAPVQVEYKSILAEDTSIIAMSVKILINAGAYSPLIDEIVERMTAVAIGIYAIPNYRIETFALKTSLPPMGVLSGWGEAQISLALENHINQILLSINESPETWKLMQSTQKKLKKQKNTYKPRLDELVEKVCTASNFSRKYTAYNLLAKQRNSLYDGPLRGIGLSVGFQGNGLISKTYYTHYSAEATMNTNSTLLIHSHINSIKIRPIIKSLAQEILAIDENQIFFSDTKIDESIESGPETLSNTIAIIVPLFEKCFSAINKLRFRQALPITVKREHKISKNSKEGEAQKDPFISKSHGACAVEVEIDPISYELKIKHIWIAVNAGKFYNSQIVKSTISSNISVAISRIFGEKIQIKQGKYIPKDSALFDILPLSEIPEIECILLESEEEGRGVGSIADNLVPAAIITALSLILKKQVISIPISPNALYKLLENIKEV